LKAQLTTVESPIGQYCADRTFGVPLLVWWNLGISRTSSHAYEGCHHRLAKYGFGYIIHVKGRVVSIWYSFCFRQWSNEISSANCLHYRDGGIYKWRQLSKQANLRHEYRYSDSAVRSMLTLGGCTLCSYCFLLDDRRQAPVSLVLFCDKRFGCRVVSRPQKSDDACLISFSWESW